MIQQLKEQVADLQEQINQNRLDNFIYPNAGAHNSIYRGKYLGDHVTDEQIEAIDAGTFEDLYIGDYWTINDVDWIVMHFNYWINSNGFTKNHAVIVPRKILYKSPFETAKISSGYYGSLMRKSYINEADVQIKDCFGDFLLEHNETVSSAVYNSTTEGGQGGRINTSSYIDVKSIIMNEVMVYGSIVSSVANPGGLGSKIYTTSKQQLRGFALNPKLISSGESYWLRDQPTGDQWCLVGSNGNTGFKIYSESWGVRPAFAIGKPDEVESEEEKINL